MKNSLLKNLTWVEAPLKGHRTILQNVATFAILWIQKGASYE
jgi:hypothetical protein